MPKTSKPKLTRATVEALDAMYDALPELMDLMRAKEFDALYNSIYQARVVYTGVMPVLNRDDDGNVTRTLVPPMSERTIGGYKRRTVESMEARLAFRGMCAADPPPKDETHWTTAEYGRRPRSAWAIRYVKAMNALGFNDRQAYEAAPETRARGRGNKRRPSPQSAEATREHKKAERAARLEKQRAEHRAAFAKPLRPGRER